MVSILMMLQTRGQITAAEVAIELEVSERTARRDLDALGVAGLPIYSTQGRNGGWRLAGDGRTDLSGLTSAEAQALFVLAGPHATSPDVRSALRKLLRALPEPMRDRAEAASGAIVHDDAAWGGTARDRATPAHLDVVQAAVINGTQIVLGYVARDRAISTRVVHPLGLATKASRWYLVADTEAGQRTFRIDRITSVEVTDVPVVRPEGFDLADSWRMITSVMEEARVPVRVRILAVPTVMSWLRHTFGTHLRIGAAVADGRVEVEVRGYSDHIVASEMAGFGAFLEVLEPPAVRARLATIAAELATLYGPTDAPRHPEGGRHSDATGPTDAPRHPEGGRHSDATGPPDAPRHPEGGRHSDATGPPESGVEFRLADSGTPPAQSAMKQYFDELSRRFSGGFDVTAAGTAADAVAMRSPTGAFVVAEIGKQVVGCGGLQRHDESTAEIKRMWIHPDWRGAGLGRQLLGHLEHIARDLGYVQVVLDTNETLTVAVAMYHRARYRVIDRYNDNPYAHHWFAKAL